MTTIARNRIEKFLPRIVGGKSYSLGSHFIGQPMDAEQVRTFVRFWRDHGLGKMTLQGSKGQYRLHSNEWVTFEVEEA